MVELQADFRLPVDNMPARHNQSRADNNPWTPELPAVHKANSGVFNSFWLVSSGGHLDVRLSWMKPNISEGILDTQAADEIPEDQLGRADQSEANPLIGLPAKWRHNQPDEMHAACTFHHKQPSTFCAWQAAGVCEDDSVIFSSKVTDDASAEGADEEIQAEGAKRWAAGNNRAALLERRTALPGDGAWILAAV